MPSKFQKLQVEDRVINQIQDNVSRIVDPLSALPLNSGQILQQIPLVIGSNSINHKLGRPLIGWFIVRKRDVAEIYDTQDSNPQPQRTLLLASDAIVSVDIYVF